MDDSHSTTNKARISALLSLMGDIPSSTNIENDLRVANASNRLFSSYELLIKWSSQFLLNKGFTTFAGSCVNQSLLFQADRLFEDFIAYLFKKYATSYNVDPQNKRYYLVDRHNGKGMFRIKPDLLIETGVSNPNYKCVILDTKWKAIDSTKPDDDYLLDIKDMYQLYAYGQKYKLGETKDKGIDVLPKLVLLYPYSEHFTKELPVFTYDEVVGDKGLKLMAVPFNLADSSTYEQQVKDIINLV